MRQDRIVRRSWWRLPRALGAAALTAAVTMAVLPAGTALASPAATPAPVYILIPPSVNVTALGRTWDLNLGVFVGSVVVSLGTSRANASETHTWWTNPAFAVTGRKDLKVTSTGHATFNTGSTLSPVLAVAVSFTPTRVDKQACAKGSENVYTGKLSGTVSLATGLRGVKVSAKFSGRAGAVLFVDKSCYSPPVTTSPACEGGAWSISGGSPSAGGMDAGQIQLFGPKAQWAESFGQERFKTASTWVSRSVDVSGDGPPPKQNTAAKTVSVSGFSSGAVTGAAVMSYRGSHVLPRTTCSMEGKKYNVTTTVYASSAVKTSKPFQAHTLLAGTLTMHAATSGSYTTVKLTAA
jgi:hypothetical protein